MPHCNPFTGLWSSCPSGSVRNPHSVPECCILHLDLRCCWQMCTIVRSSQTTPSWLYRRKSKRANYFSWGQHWLQLRMLPPDPPVSDRSTRISSALRWIPITSLFHIPFWGSAITDVENTRTRLNQKGCNQPDKGIKKSPHCASVM